MKRYLLLFVVFAFLIQPCYAAEKKKLEEYKKPDGSIVHHDVCLYTVAPNETSMYKEYYPLLDGETRSVPADTSIYVNITKSDVKTVSIRIFDESFEFYKFKYTAEDEQAPNPTVNSDLFAGKVTLLLSIVYNDDTVEEHKYYFEKIDLYNDLDLQDLKILKSDNRSGTTIAANVDGGKAVLHPEKISVKSSSGKECYSCEDGPAMLINQRLTIPFASDGLNREYTVIIPKGVILLDTGLNVEFASKIQNEIDYVVPQNYLKSMTPADGQIKYINGVSENVKFSININSGFTVDITKTISVDDKKVDYNIEKTSNGTLITFEALVEAENKYNIMFEPGIIVADNSEVSGKDYFGFSVIDLNTIDLPEKAVFTDVFVDDWAYEYITQLAVRDIISG